MPSSRRTPPPRPGPPRAGQEPPSSGPAAASEEAPRDTKDRILDVAEDLFARLGYAGASLRSVTRQAGVNLAAVHYHFGSKLGLFEAVFERRARSVNDERLARLDALEAAAAQDGPDLEAILQAFVEPALCGRAADDPTFARFQRFVGRALSETGEHVEAMRSVFREVQLRFLPAFQRALPHLSERDVLWRVHFLVGAMCSQMTDPTRIGVLSEGRCDGTDVRASVRQLIAFGAGALRAAPTADGSPPTDPEVLR